MRWRWSQGDLEIRAWSLPAVKTKYVSVDACFQIAFLWMGQCVGVYDLFDHGRN